MSQEKKKSRFCWVNLCYIKSFRTLLRRLQPQKKFRALLSRLHPQTKILTLLRHLTHRKNFMTSWTSLHSQKKIQGSAELTSDTAKLLGPCWDILSHRKESRPCRIEIILRNQGEKIPGVCESIWATEKKELSRHYPQKNKKIRKLLSQFQSKKKFQDLFEASAVTKKI